MTQKLAGLAIGLRCSILFWRDFYRSSDYLRAERALRAGLNYHLNWAAPAPVLAKF